jgi:hypothetical protein
MQPVAVSIHPVPPRRFGPAKADCTPAQARAKLDAALKNLAARTYTRRDLRRALARNIPRRLRRRPIVTALISADYRARQRAPHRVHRAGSRAAGTRDYGGGDGPSDPPPHLTVPFSPARHLRCLVRRP